MRFGDCVLDLDRWELRRRDTPVPLEPKAMHVLERLIRNRDRVLTKSELLDTVWGSRFVSESALTTQIKELRRAVGDSGREQAVVKTVHGQGYMFVAPVRDGADDADRIDATVTVLPFENLSPDPSQAHIVGGLTSDVIAALWKHRWLRVVTHPPVVDDLDPADAIDRLRTGFGIGYVVTGSVLLDGDRLRVNVALTETTNALDADARRGRIRRCRDRCTGRHVRWCRRRGPGACVRRAGLRLPCGPAGELAEMTDEPPHL